MPASEVHHRLRIVAGAAFRRQRRLQRADLLLGGGKRRLDPEDPRQHPLDIAVHDRCRLVIGDGGDRRGRIVADAGQGAQSRRVAGKAAAMVAHHRFRAGLQVAGPRIIAEPGPGLHHLLGGGCGEVGDARPAEEEGVVIGLHRRDRGLLQHDLGEPDPIGVRHGAGCTLARPDAPGQAAGMAVVPGEQGGGRRRGGGRNHRAILAEHAADREPSI